MQIFPQHAHFSGDGRYAPVWPAAMRGGGSDNRLDIYGLYLILKRRAPLVAAITAVSVAIAVAYLMSATRMYSSSVQILIDPRQKIIVGSQIRTGGLGFDKAMIASQVSIIGSDTVLRRVVKTYNLAADPEFIGKPGLYDHLKSRLGLSRKGPGGDPEARALKTLYKHLSVKRANLTYVIEVSVSSAVPEKAAKLAQGVAEAYLADQSDAKIITTRQASSLLAERLDELRDKVRAVETQIEKFKIRYNIVAAEGKLVNEQRLNRLNDQLIVARSETAQARARYNKVRGFVRSGIDLDSTYEAVNSALIARLRTQYAEIARRHSNLKASLGSSHPGLISVRAQLEQTRQLIRDELSRIAKTARNEYDIALVREKAILKNLEASKNQASLSNAARIKLRELQREAMARRAIFQSFLVRERETREQENLQTPDARIISAAIIPVNPSYPRKKLILVMALIAGLGLGVLAALSVELFSRKDDGPLRAEFVGGPVAGANEPLQSLSGAASGMSGIAAANSCDAPPPPGISIPQPFAVIPRLERLSPSGWPVAANDVGSLGLRDFATALDDPGYLPPSAFNVAVYDLLQKLHVPRPGETSRRILLCAPGTGEGVSTISCSLAMAASLSGERALLVDADMMRPDLSGQIAAHSRLSVADVVNEYVSLEQIVVRDEHFGLDLLPLVPPYGQELDAATQGLLARRMAGLGGKYRFVFIDGGCVFDNLALQSHLENADDVLLVVREGAHNRAGIAHALNVLGVGPDKFRGIVSAISARQMSRAG